MWSLGVGVITMFLFFSFCVRYLPLCTHLLFETHRGKCNVSRATRLRYPAYVCVIEYIDGIRPFYKSVTLGGI